MEIGWSHDGNRLVHPDPMMTQGRNKAHISQLTKNQKVLQTLCNI